MRYVLVRASLAEERVLVTLVSSRTPLPHAERLARRLRTAVPLAGLLLNENTTTGNVILGPRTECLWGEEVLRERYGDVTIAAGPTAFVQANTRMAAAIYGAIAAAADLDGRGPRRRSLLRRRRHRVDPGTAGRVRDRHRGDRGRGRRGARERRAGAGARRALRRRSRRGGCSATLADPVDVLTLNPPRKGAGPRVAAEIARLAPRRVLYLSCNPESFARDAAALVGGGLALARVQPFDLIPQTDHVELLGTFVRDSAPL